MTVVSRLTNFTYETGKFMYRIKPCFIYRRCTIVNTAKFSVFSRSLQTRVPQFRLHKNHVKHEKKSKLLFTQSHSRFLVTKSSSAQGQKDSSYISLLVLGSIVIGGFIFILLTWKFYGNLQYRARGIELIPEPLLGKRQYLYKYRGFVYPDFVANNVDKIHHFKVREDDVWIMSHPKAGTTWMEEIVFLISSNLDFETANTKTLEDRVPYFEFEYPGIKFINEIKSPRIIKSHLPMSFLPGEFRTKKPKIVYVARNAKDSAVSYYYFYKMLKTINYRGNMMDFVNRFAEDKYFYGPWWKHVTEAWKLRDQENVLFIKYEDMKKDIHSVIKQVADYLGKPLTVEQINIIAEHTKFDVMKNNPMSNYSWWRSLGFKDGKTEFLRKGKVGDWEVELTPYLSEKIDAAVKTRLQNTGLVFEDK